MSEATTQQPERIKQARECYQAEGIESTLIVYGYETTLAALNEVIAEQNETTPMEAMICTRFHRMLVEQLITDDDDLTNRRY